MSSGDTSTCRANRPVTSFRLIWSARDRDGLHGHGSNIKSVSRQQQSSPHTVISGAVSADITWEQDFLPNCYATTAGDGAQAFFFGATIRGPYQLYASIHSFRGAGSYDAAAAPAQIGRFDWRTAAVTVFKLGNDESERWLATAGSFIVASSDSDSAAGSLDADLAPAGADAKGPIHVTGSWTCRHSGN